MSSGAVDLGGDVVSGAMGKSVCEPGVADEGTGGLVGFPALQPAVVGEGVLDRADRGVPGITNSLEDEVFAFGGLPVDHPSPR